MTHFIRLATRLILFVLGTMLIANSASARDEYLGWWGDEYGATSDSNDAVCQLCHERGGGGNGWNRYGWLVRDLYILNSSITDPEERLKTSLQDIEDLLSDPNNGGSASFVSEINAGAQPGWRNGNVNEIRFRDDTPTKTIAPPASLPCALLIDQADTERTCSTANPIPTQIPRANVTVGLKSIATGFRAPVAALAAPGEPESLYVVEQGGEVWRVVLATGEKHLFLDFSAELVSNYGNPIPGFPGYDERGLLGFAFHPDYANNRKIVTYYSAPYVEGAAHFSTLPAETDADHMSVVSEWVVLNPLSLTPTAISERTILVVDQPQFNHNGGMLEFGPQGMLFIALGDGGNANDAGDGHGEDGNGRDNTSPLGAILRIDIDAVAPANGRYGIPPDNPFVGIQGLDEIYVYGLRNPYRFSLDMAAGNAFNLYIGDVGQDAIEEVNRIPSTAAGANLGWNYKEGSFYFSVIDGLTYVSETPPDGVVIPPLVDPVVEYDHGEGISVIGGYVYRGSAISELAGKYVFGDWGRGFGTPDGRLFVVDVNNTLRELRLEQALAMHVTGFGKGADNELYVVGSPDFVVTADTGSLKKIVPAQSICFPIKALNQALAIICL